MHSAVDYTGLESEDDQSVERRAGARGSLRTSHLH